MCINPRLSAFPLHHSPPHLPSTPPPVAPFRPRIAGDIMFSTIELANLLRRKVAGEPFPHSFIHEVDVCSDPPEDLVRGREHAQGDTDAWYICSPAHFHQSASGGPRRRRKRNVRGGRQGGRWHPEAGKKAIKGPDGEPVGAYTRMLSYLFKDKNQTGIRKERLGWCMLEVGLVQEDGGAEQLVLCKVYRSSRADPAVISTEISLPGGGTPYPAPPCQHDNQVTVCNTQAHVEAEIPSRMAIARKGSAAAGVTDVIDLCGSSILPANRTKDMSKLVLSLENPVVVVSTMGNTATDILLATWKALSCGVRDSSEIPELAISTKELHLRTIDELGLDGSIVSGPLGALEHHLQCVAKNKELTPATRDYLVSFGEYTSTKLFYEYLNELGKEIGQEWKLRTVTTFGRGGSDLTAATIGEDLGSGEIQVWKDEGLFTCDPNVCAEATPLSCLTFDEATELGFFSVQAMDGGISVRVKNSFNPHAPGTLITETRDTSKSTLTSIVLKSNITILDIQRTGMLNQDAFAAKAISIFHNFEYLGISVSYMGSEGTMSFTLVPSKLSSQELIEPANDKAVKELQEIATVDRIRHRSVISLVGNPHRSTVILERALNVLQSSHVEWKFWQGSSKVTVSLMVDDSDAKDCVQALHSAFFGNGIVSEARGAENECATIPVNSPAAASSSAVNKRRADDDHPEAPPSVRQVQGAGTDPDVRPEETKTQLSLDPATVRDDDFVDLDEIINPNIIEYWDGNGSFADFDFSGGVQFMERQELTEAEEGGIGLRSVTGETEHSHLEWTYKQILGDGRDLGFLWSNNDPMPVGGDNAGDPNDIFDKDDVQVKCHNRKFTRGIRRARTPESRSPRAHESGEVQSEEESGSDTEEMAGSHQQGTYKSSRAHERSMPSAGYTYSLRSRLAARLPY